MTTGERPETFEEAIDRINEALDRAEERLIIPTRRDEENRIYFQVAHDIEIVFDPEDTWIEIRDLDEYEPQAALIGVEQIDRMIETLKRIKRMALDG